MLNKIPEIFSRKIARKPCGKSTVTTSDTTSYIEHRIVETYNN